MDTPTPRRKLLSRIEHPGHARYLTFSCYNRLPLFQNDAIKHVFLRQLLALRQSKPFHLYAWVIMPEHVHLLVMPELSKYPVSRFLSDLKRPVAERILRRWRQLQAPILTRLHQGPVCYRFWQAGGGYDRNIFSSEELLEKITYIHNNPVRRELSKRAIDWPWSSMSWYEGDRNALLPIDPLP